MKTQNRVNKIEVKTRKKQTIVYIYIKKLNKYVTLHP